MSLVDDPAATTPAAPGALDPEPHRQVAVSHGDRAALVDEAIAPLIGALWRADVETVHSCQGEPGGDPDDMGSLAYVMFASQQDRERFAARVPPAEGWHWFIDHEVAGGRDSVHFPPADLRWLVDLF